MVLLKKSGEAPAEADDGSVDLDKYSKLALLQATHHELHERRHGANRGWWGWRSWGGRGGGWGGASDADGGLKPLLAPCVSVCPVCFPC